MADDIAKSVVARFEHMYAQRAPWHNLWQQITDYIMPNRGDFPNDPNMHATGEDRTGQIFDGTAIWANEQFASGLSGFVVNPTEKWFALTSGDERVDRIRAVKEWLQIAESEMYAVFNSPRSNFYGQIHEMFLDIGGFGTAMMMVEEMKNDSMVRYMTYPLAECYIAEGPDGLVDTLYRQYTRTAKQLVDMYGDKVALPNAVTVALEKEPTKRFEVIHAIEPRVVFDADKGDALNMPYRSAIVLKTGCVLLEESGYREFPVAASRWVLVSGEEYGRSPGMNCIYDVKMVNTMRKTIIRSAQKIVDPPLQMPDEGFMMPVKLNPSSINYFEAGISQHDRIMPIQTGGNPYLGMDIVQSHVEQILRCYYIDLMQIMKNVEMTATEVLQRTEDRMRLMAPMVTRFQHEALDRAITRTFNILRRRRRIPDPPEELAGIDIKYSSQVARAQKATRLFEFQRFLESLANVAQFKPEIIDRLDGDGAFEFAHHLLDAPVSITVPQQIVDQIRAQRNAQNNAAQGAEALGKLAPWIKANSEKQQ